MSKKHCNEIAQLLLSPDRQIISLCLDSTCLGRHGFMAIMNAASKSSSLTYLDVADTNFTPFDANSPKNSRRKNRRGSNRNSKNNDGTKQEMDKYHRKEAIDCILQLLSSSMTGIEHLIIGHNNLNYDECKIIAQFAANRGLTTLDLYGNNIEPDALCGIHDILYEKRMEISQQEFNRKKEMPSCISSLIIEYAIHQTQCLYRCFKWKPR